MKTYTAAEFSTGLREAGVCAGDIIYIHSQLFTLSQLARATSKEDLCARILAACFEVLTDRGTLVVPVFTTQTARYGVPFCPGGNRMHHGGAARVCAAPAGQPPQPAPHGLVAAIGRQKEAVRVGIELWPGHALRPHAEAGR